MMEVLAGAWSPLAVAYLTAALLVALVGGAVLFYERFTVASRRFFVVTAIAAGWLTTLAFAVLAPSTAGTGFWLRATWVLDPFTAPALFWMTQALTGTDRPVHQRWMWGVGAAFSATSLSGPWLVEGLQSATRGFTLAGWGWLGFPYFAFISAVMALSVNELARSRSRAATRTSRLERSALLWGTVVATSTVADYWLPWSTYRAGWLTPPALAIAGAVGLWVALRFRVFAARRTFGTDEALRTMSDAVLMLDAAGRVRRANRAACELLARDEADILGHDVSEFIWRDREGWRPEPGEAFRDRKLMAMASDGLVTPVSVATVPLIRADYQAGTVLVARDIRERLAVEQALEAAKLRYNSLFWHNPGLTYELGVDGRFVNLNDAMARLAGKPRTELIGSSFSDLLAPESLEVAQAVFENALEGEPEQYDMTLRTQAGRTVTLKGVSVPIIEEGELVGIAGLAFDVTGERRARRELEVQRRYFEALFENLPEALALIDENDKIQRVNREFTRLFGYTEEEAVGQNVEELVVPEHLWDQGRDMARTVVSGEEVHVETVRRRKDGSTVEVSVLGHELSIPGVPQQMYGIYRDISERKEAERRLQEREVELRHSKRLEAVGKLAGGVAHDFNNLLTVINGHVSLALDQAPDNAALVTDLKEVEQAGARAAALTQQLLAYSRRQVLHPRVVDANSAIGDLLTMLDRLIGEHIRIEVDLAEDTLRVRADRGQLEQVVVNMALNARDAMPEGGTLRLESAAVELAEGDPKRQAWEVDPGEYVRLRVADTGSGMDADTLSRVFEPFFTTKPQGAGTGLGLSTAFGIIKQSGGHISARSEPDEGTVLDVFLPRVDAEPESRDQAGNGSGEANGLTGSVLVAEDEAPVRQLAVRILKREGCHVLAAENGVRALEILEESSHAVDLVITDIIMPEMGGHELADRLLRRWPDLPILFMSGYDDKLAGGHGDAADFLAKPFTPTEFVAWVARGLRRA